MPQLVNVAPVAPAGAGAAGGAAPDATVAAAFTLPDGATEAPADASVVAARNLRRVPRGEVLPEGGNLLPVVVGLLPPVTSLSAGVPTDASNAAGAGPPNNPPPVLAALPQPGRPSLERGAKSAPAPRSAPSAFDHLLAGSLPAEARAAIAAAHEAAATAGGDNDAAATPVPQSSSPSSPLTASVVAADVPGSSPVLYALPPVDAAADDLPGALPDLPRPPTATPALDAAALPAAVPPERRDAAAAPHAAEPIGVERAVRVAVIDAGSPPEAVAAPEVAADAPPPAFAQLLPAAPRAADGGTVMNLATPVGSPGWSDAVGERVAWLVQQDLGSAHLKLNPPQLGPVEVRVQISGDQAAVSFTAHNQQTRDALADASQRLRDLLGAQGFVNVQVDVGQQPFQERPMLFAPYEDDAAPAAQGGAARSMAAAHGTRGARALLDAYA